jgi:hypothetical protein
MGNILLVIVLGEFVTKLMEEASPVIAGNRQAQTPSV